MTSLAGGPVSSKLLLVEGNDDRRFFGAMREHLGVTGIEIDSYNGKDKLRNDLAERVRNPDFQTVASLGIVRDADNSSQSAFESVRGSLRRADLPVPDAPATPIERDGLRVSVLILPPDDDKGELENVCLNSIESAADLQCVETYFDCLSKVEPLISANHLAKARLHSYLAAGPVYATQGNESARRRPGLRLGEAAEAGVWDWSSPAFDRVVEFLRNL